MFIPALYENAQAPESSGVQAFGSMSIPALHLWKGQAPERGVQALGQTDILCLELKYRKYRGAPTPCVKWDPSRPALDGIPMKHLS